MVEGLSSCGVRSSRLEQNSKVFADIFKYLEDKGLHGELWGKLGGRRETEREEGEGGKRRREVV
jgi:hypothetical protein